MSTDIHLRRCVPGDEAALGLVGQATFLETFAASLAATTSSPTVPKRMMPSSIARGWRIEHALWLAEVGPGNAPIGYMVVVPSQLPLPDTSGDVELKRIYLLGKLQGGGLGRRPVAAAITHSASVLAKRLLLGVYAHNRSAISFYERAGFGKLGSRKFNAGGKGYDDNIMGISLDS